MRSLVQEMIYYRNSLGEDEELDAVKVKELEGRYRKALKTAEDECTDVPPNEYYREGYNLYKRMVGFMHNHLPFLHDKNLLTNNNVSERCLRSYKRKQKQVITLRSLTSLEDNAKTWVRCRCIETARKKTCSAAWPGYSAEPLMFDTPPVYLIQFTCSN